MLPARVTADRTSGQTRAYDILPDGRFVRFVSAAETEAPGAALGLTAEIRLVINWFEELKQRVPSK